MRTELKAEQSLRAQHSSGGEQKSNGPKDMRRNFRKAEREPGVGQHRGGVLGHSSVVWAPGSSRFHPSLNVAIFASLLPHFGAGLRTSYNGSKCSFEPLGQIFSMLH